MELNRTMEQWRGCDPEAMAYHMSEAATMYAFKDAKADILALHAENERLRAQAQHESDCAEAYKTEADRLRDENASLSAQLIAFQTAWPGGVDEVSSVIESLRDENAKLREDAERYAFLRDSTCCSLILSRNEDHACNYVTAKQWIEEFGTANDWSDVPPDELQRMKDTNTIWALQIYPNTPVGFNRWSRSTLDAAIDAAMQKGE